MKSVADDLT